VDGKCPLCLGHWRVPASNAYSTDLYLPFHAEEVLDVTHAASAKSSSTARAQTDWPTVVETAPAGAASTSNTLPGARARAIRATGRTNGRVAPYARGASFHVSPSTIDSWVRGLDQKTDPEWARHVAFCALEVTTKVAQTLRRTKHINETLKTCLTEVVEITMDLTGDDDGALVPAIQRMWLHALAFMVRH
jgi:hypothetical protein